MKKILSLNLFCQKLEVIKNFKFNQPVVYYEEKENFEGHSCGINTIFFFNKYPQIKLTLRNNASAVHIIESV